MAVKLSILIPVYNVESYLRECLDSVLSYDGDDIEVICVNDGSTDGCLGILRDYAEKDSRLVLINKENNEGLVEGRRSGVNAARGEHVIFVDSDDFLAPLAIQQILQLLEDHPNMDLIRFQCDFFGIETNSARGKWLSRMFKTENRCGTKEDLLKIMFIDQTAATTLWGKIFRRDLMNQLFSDLPFMHVNIGEDIFLQLLYAYRIKTFCEVKTPPLYLYRVNAGISRTDAITPARFSQFCEMSKICSFIMKQGAADEAFLPFAETATKRMITDCLRNYGIAAKSATISDRLKMSETLLEQWKTCELFPSVLISLTGRSLDYFTCVGIADQNNLFQNGSIISKESGNCNINTLAAELQNLNNQIISLKSDNSAITHKNDELCILSANLKERLEQTNDKVCKLERDLEDVLGKNTNLQKNLENLQENNDNQIIRNNELIAELETVRRDYLRYRKLYQDQNNSLSFKIGRMCTFLPRKIRDIINHGKKDS